MKNLLKRLLGSQFLSAYHFCLAWLSAFYYYFPSRKLVVIGVTGTKGKTSTANFIWSCLMAGGLKTGIITTANIRIGNEMVLNKYHMTMPGRNTIQSLLAQMAHQGCTHVVIETTSEGIRQFRHKGIDYDATVFTNLAPEHLASHGGSFDAYKEAKGKLMASLELSFRKTLRGQKVEKMIIANNDSPFKTYFLQFSADKKWTFGLTEEADISAKEVQSGEQGVDFLIGDTPFHLNILGAFNVSNALPAILLAREFGVSDEQIQEGLKNLVLIPGRMERIDEGQPFSVFVDYAHEKLSLTAVMDTADALKKPGSRTILLLGAEGGGRDKSKRPLMGEVAATRADFVVVTNVDPYSDDPKEIIEDIAKAAEQFGKVRDKDLFTIEDRRMGIRKALCLAKSDDIVFITGKGAEQSIIIHGISSPWDDRTVVREELKRLHE